MNKEHHSHKVGTIGELLVRIRLNELGINIGFVEKDTGTDMILFQGSKILTAQVKTGLNSWNNSDTHGVHVHFKVFLASENQVIALDQSKVVWRRVDILGKDFINLTSHSASDIFNFEETQ